MKLTDVDLKGYGRFLDSPASFEVTKFFTPDAWDYVFTNRKMLLRVRHDGTGYVQLEPPCGPMLYKMERYQQYPGFFLWVKPEAEGAFSNFYKPNFDVQNPDREPDEYSCTFSPAGALYRLVDHGLEVISEFTIAPDDPAVLARFTIRNLGPARRVDLMPVWRPHNTSTALEPWDVPELYQTCRYVNAEHQVIWIETRNPMGLAHLRRRSFVMTDLEADTAEVFYDRFIGKGTFPLPQAALDGALGIDASKKYAYLEENLENTVTGAMPVAAFHKGVELPEGESFSFSMVLAGLPEVADGSMPPYAEIARYEAFLGPDGVKRASSGNGQYYDSYRMIRTIDTPDEAFNSYVNDWIPLQLRWVTMLGRGWPVSTRGTRDAAQDFTGLIPFFPGESRKALLEIFTCQRSDGWFPRAYSVEGPEGQHGARDYVDAGCWVWELLYDYLRFTGDRAVLEEKVRWMDSKEESAILDHARALFAYYMNAENIGEHGLVKIRAGDWNDSVNAAGLEGRGETVMVSCQVVLAMNQAAALTEHLGLDGADYRKAADTMRRNIRKHALNREGYLNAVFNDDGKWIFSPDDPDGAKRINSPVNSFGIIAGVFEENELPRVFEHLKTLKRDNGYALFLPAIGNPPIPKLGRIGQGDLLGGLGENGTPYNHGSHGFLGRAAAAAGCGSFLQDVMKYMLPYDQQAHPIEVSQSAPYGIVNHWMSIEGQFGKGGATFLSGSISTALRNVYGGMMGFEPTLDGITISPRIPSVWERASYVHNFRGGVFKVTIDNPDGVESGVKFIELNGRRIEGSLISTDAFIDGTENVVRVVLG